MSAASCRIAAAVVLLLLLPPTAVAQPPHPGDNDYCLHLTGIFADRGLLTEDGKDAGAAFDPQGSKFTLRVPDPKVAVVSLMLQFDFPKYALGELPNLYFDGQQQEINVIKPIKMVISLDASWHTFDQTFQIKIEDPYRPHWFRDFWRWLTTLVRGHRAHVYEVRVMQPPDLGVAPLVAGVTLKDARGARLDTVESLVRGVGNNEYTFVLPRGDSTATLQVSCSDKANGLSYDQSGVEPGSTCPVDLLNEVRKVITASCSYREKQWPSVGRNNILFVTILKNVTVDDMEVMLSAVSADGHCENDGSGGFICKVISDRLQFVPRFSDNRARAELVGKDGETRMYLPNVRVKELIVGAGSEEYKIVMRLGSSIREFPVKVIRPAWCVSMTCPAGMTLKGSLKHDKDAESITCKRETCSAEDVTHCCESAATCNTFTSPCPAGQVLRGDAKTSHCLGLECSPADAVRCCQAKAVCSSHTCPAQTKLRSDAALIMCNSWQCAEDDSGTCCVGWRSHYLFGYVIGVEVRNLTEYFYKIHFDFGLEEVIPAWAVMKFDVFAGKLSSGQIKVGDRAEGRVNDTVAAELMSRGISVYGVAVRERTMHYMAVGCGPVPQICLGKTLPDDYKFIPQSPGALPVGNFVPREPYNATLNPSGLRLCYYDPSCQTDPSQLGCKYWGPDFVPQPYPLGQGPRREGWSTLCRACGFGKYPRCPSVPDCTYEDESVWSPEKKKFCCNAYRIACPYDCRFGDDTVRTQGSTPAIVKQEEFEGRFKYWTKEQTSWCCDKHGIGCGALAESFVKGKETDAVERKVLLPLRHGTHAGGVHRHGLPFPPGFLSIGFLLAASVILATAIATRALRRLPSGFSRVPQSPAGVRSLLLARRAAAGQGLT